MNRKVNYVAIANSPVRVPYPYQYREQLIHGRIKADQAYTIGQILAAYLDKTGLSAYEFARRVSAWSEANGYGIKVGHSSIMQYIRGICKPKSEIRDMLAAYLRVEDSFITGYRSVAGFEMTLERRIHAESDKGFQAIAA